MRTLIFAAAAVLLAPMASRGQDDYLQKDEAEPATPVICGAAATFIKADYQKKTDNVCGDDGSEVSDPYPKLQAAPDYRSAAPSRFYFWRSQEKNAAPVIVPKGATGFLPQSMVIACLGPLPAGIKGVMQDVTSKSPPFPFQITWTFDAARQVYHTRLRASALKDGRPSPLLNPSRMKRFMAASENMLGYANGYCQSRYEAKTRSPAPITTTGFPKNHGSALKPSLDLE